MNINNFESEAQLWTLYTALYIFLFLKQFWHSLLFFMIDFRIIRI